MLSNKIKNEIKDCAVEAIKYGQIENDYEYLKRLISEEYPELTDQDLIEAANIYTEICW